MQFIYLIFGWTFNYGNLVISPRTSKQLHMKIYSQSGGAQTESLWFLALFCLFTDLSMFCCCKYVKLKTIFLSVVQSIYIYQLSVTERSNGVDIYIRDMSDGLSGFNGKVFEFSACCILKSSVASSWVVVFRAFGCSLSCLLRYEPLESENKRQNISLNSEAH